MIKARHRSVAYVVLAVAGFLLSLAFSTATTEELHPRSITLKYRADSLLFAPNSRRLLVISKDDQSISQIEESGTVYARYQYDLPGFLVTDVALGTEGNYAYFVGQMPEGHGYLIRLNLITFQGSKVLFSEKTLKPSIAVSGMEKIFIGDLTVSTVSIADNLFDSLEPQALRSDPRKNIFLQAGAAIDLSVSPDGQYLFTSNERASVISLIDVNTGATLQEINGHFTMTAATELKEESRVGLILGDPDTARIVLATINPDFGVLELGNVAGLGLKEARVSPSKIATRPLIIAADADLETIVVGDQRSDQASVFTRNAKALERINLLELGDSPLGITLSMDGELLAVLSQDGRSVALIENPREPRGVASHVLGSNLVREGQRYLAQLKYYTGGVDGLDGPSTRQAVGLFQKDQSLETTGIVDEITLQRLRDVANAWFAIVGQFFVSTDRSKPEDLAKATAKALQEAKRQNNVEIVRGITSNATRNIVVVRTSGKADAESIVATLKNFGKTNDLKGAVARQNLGWTKVAECSPSGCKWYTQDSPQCNQLGGVVVCGSGCAPVTAECCSDGSYCDFGKCWSSTRGTVFCCPYSARGINGRCLPL